MLFRTLDSLGKMVFLFWLSLQCIFLWQHDVKCKESGIQFVTQMEEKQEWPFLPSLEVRDAFVSKRMKKMKMDWINRKRRQENEERWSEEMQVFVIKRQLLFPSGENLNQKQTSFLSSLQNKWLCRRRATSSRKEALIKLTKGEKGWRGEWKHPILPINRINQLIILGH